MVQASPNKLGYLIIQGVRKWPACNQQSSAIQENSIEISHALIAPSYRIKLRDKATEKCKEGYVSANGGSPRLF